MSGFYSTGQNIRKGVDDDTTAVPAVIPIPKAFSSGKVFRRPTPRIERESAGHFISNNYLYVRHPLETFLDVHGSEIVSNVVQESTPVLFMAITLNTWGLECDPGSKTKMTKPCS